MADLFEEAENGAAWARGEDPNTSHAAAESVRGQQANELETRVIRALMKYPEGLASYEIECLTGIPNQSLTPRLAPLRRKGLIKDSGFRRVAPSGRQQTVWVEGSGEPEKVTLPLPKVGELVVVAHWEDFQLEDATVLGRFSHRDSDGYFYIDGSQRGWRYLKRLRSHTLNHEL
jgi:hypothetical protein